MLYKIDHYYAVDHSNFCLLIDSDYDVDEIISLISAYQFYAEELFDDVSVSLDSRCLNKILCGYYEIDDVKEKYRHFLDRTALSASEWELTNTFYIEEHDLCIIQIDWYEAREACCGPDWHSHIEKWLPKNPKAAEAIRQLILNDGREL